MDIEIYKNEFIKYRDEMYEKVWNEIKESYSEYDVNAAFEREFARISDYWKYMTKKLFKDSGLAPEGMDTEFKLETVDFDKDNIYTERIVTREREVYAHKQIVDMKSRATMIICAVSGLIIGFIIRNNIIDAIITGFMLGLMGSIVYETMGSSKNKILEKIKIKENEQETVMNEEYINEIIEKRKKEVSDKMMELIDKFGGR
ncbi:MAG: hypothetical protein AB9844_12450 [Clostridiaceae bacterium]